MSVKLRELAATGSAGENNTKPNRKAQLLTFGVIAVVVVFGFNFFNRGSVRPDPGVVVAASESATPVVVTATPTATVEPTWTPSVLYAEVTRVVEVPVEVTREVTRYVTEPYPVEVTRIVEVAAQQVALSTPTPVPLAQGSVRICADVAGAESLYIGGRGVVSGGCEVYSFGVGQTSIQVQVNR